MTADTADAAVAPEAPAAAGETPGAPDPAEARIPENRSSKPPSGDRMRLRPRFRLDVVPAERSPPPARVAKIPSPESCAEMRRASISPRAIAAESTVARLRLKDSPQGGCQMRPPDK